MIHYFSFLQPPDRFCLTAANYRLRNSKDSHQKSRQGGGGNIRNAGSGTPTYTIRPSGQTNTNRPPITMNQSTMPRLQLNTGKAMKSSYFLRLFWDLKFWRFFLLKIKTGWVLRCSKVQICKQ